MFEYDKEMEYMPPLAASSHASASSFASIILFCIVGFFASFIWWSSHYEIDQVAKGNMRVVPSKQLQIVSHLEGGIIEKILVNEGQNVKKGQVIAKVDNTRAKAKFEANLVNYNMLYCEVLKLTYLIKGAKQLNIPKTIMMKMPKIAAQTFRDFSAISKQVENEREIAQRQLEQRRQDKVEFEKKIIELTKQQQLLAEELQLNKQMLKDGIVPKVDVLKLERETSEFKTKIDSATLSIKKAVQGIAQEQDKIEQVDFGFRSQWLKELNITKAKLSEAKELITTQKDRVKRTDLRSPVTGVVKSILINTEGGIIRPGAKIMEIVPGDDKLLIEAKIIPSDVGMIKKSDNAIVKVAAYDYAIYGGLDGRVVDISADSFTDEQGLVFFRVKIATNKNFIQADDKKLYISPGMTGSVDIVTGQKTILQAIMKPILRSFEGAMRQV